MVWYKPESMNPFKHPDMPDTYPWVVSNSFIDDGIEISEIDLEVLISSIDLTNYHQSIQKEQNLERQKNQREFGEYLVPELIDLMGERNLTLIQNGTPVSITSLAQDNASVKLLIETGALATARSICGVLKAKYPNHSDIYDHVIVDITEFLQATAYE